MTRVIIAAIVTAAGFALAWLSADLQLVVAGLVVGVVAALALAFSIGRLILER